MVVADLDREGDPPCCQSLQSGWVWLSIGSRTMLTMASSRFARPAPAGVLPESAGRIASPGKRDDGRPRVYELIAEGLVLDASSLMTVA
jgi:hypothetical protein